MIHLLLLRYAKKLAKFRVFPANPDKIPTDSLFAPQTSFLAPILHKFFACANVLLEFYERMNRIFIQACFFCNHPDTQSEIFRHHSSHHFHILTIC